MTTRDGRRFLTRPRRLGEERVHPDLLQVSSSDTDDMAAQPRQRAQQAASFPPIPTDLMQQIRYSEPQARMRMAQQTFQYQMGMQNNAQTMQQGERGQFFQCETTGCPSIGIVFSSKEHFDEHHRTAHAWLDYSTLYSQSAMDQTASQGQYPVPRVHVGRDRPPVAHDVRTARSETLRHSDKDPSIRQEGRYLSPELRHIDLPQPQLRHDEQHSSFDSPRRRIRSSDSNSKSGGFEFSNPEDIFAQFWEGNPNSDRSNISNPHDIFEQFANPDPVPDSSREHPKLARRFGVTTQEERSKPATVRPRTKPKPVDVSFWT